MDMFDSDLADLGRSTQYVESDRREHCVLLNPRQNHGFIWDALGIGQLMNMVKQASTTVQKTKGLV
jgi:hypothetical protein